MKKNHPDPDMSAPGVSSQVASATDFTGIAQNLEQQDVAQNVLEAHLSHRMKKEKKSDKL